MYTPCCRLTCWKAGAPGRGHSALRSGATSRTAGCLNVYLPALGEPGCGPTPGRSRGARACSILRPAALCGRAGALYTPAEAPINCLSPSAGRATHKDRGERQTGARAAARTAARTPARSPSMRAPCRMGKRPRCQPQPHACAVCQGPRPCECPGSATVGQARGQRSAALTSLTISGHRLI